MADVLMLIVFVALVAGAAELVRAYCRRQVRASILIDRMPAPGDPAEHEPVTR